MADLKISALPAASTPVAGTEVLPIVQSSATKKVSIDNLTKGRVVNALTFDTDVAAAGVTLTGTTLSADGTDANISINVTPKGTGTVNTSGYGISIPGVNTAAILSNDASGLVVTEYGVQKLTVRGVGPSGEYTSIQAGEGNTTAYPNYTFINDSDTGLFNSSLSAPNKLSVVAGGVEYVSTATATTIVNDTGADHDFRVEGDTDTNLLFTDASTDRVGVGTNTPDAKFTVNGVVAVGDGSVSAPGLANTGDLDTGVYFPVANEIAVATGGVVSTSFNSHGMYFRNRIINGDMRIDQWSAGASVAYTGGGQYNIDRWTSNTNGSLATGAGLSSQQVTDAPTGFVNSFKWSTVAGQSATAGQTPALTQYIEGYNVADLLYGSANAKTTTLSFWVKSSLTGTYCVAFTNSAANRSYVSEYTISSADTWEFKTITVPGDTSGTWLTTNGIGLRVRFDLGSGTSSQGTAGSWQAANLFCTSARADWIGTASATFFLTGVQLEVGSVATPFERRPFGTELMLCQRYFESSFQPGTQPAQNVGTGTGETQWLAIGAGAVSAASPTIRFAVPKCRTSAVSITFYNPSAANAQARDVTGAVDCSATSATNATANGFFVTTTGNAATASLNSIRVHWTANSEL